MKKTISLLVLLFMLPFIATSQNNEPKDSTRMKLTRAAREIMTTSKTCALITLDSEGRPRVRTMDPFPSESDFTVWLGTNPNSRKVSQIKNDPRVTLYYLDSDNSGYVTIYGKAELVNDPKEKEMHWKDAWKTFYPNRPEGYLLIKVSPQWMEIISMTRGIFGDPTTWEPPRVVFDSK